jgi:hypothetical protein
MEFIATYSWAFMLMAIVLSSIYIIVMAPASGPTFDQSLCYVSQSLPCYQAVMLANSTGSKFIAILQNGMGVSMYFPAGTFLVYPVYMSNVSYAGSCLPQTAPPGATVVCNVTLSGYGPAVGSEINPSFSMGYQVCPDCNDSGPYYNTSGVSALSVAAYDSIMYHVKLVTSAPNGTISVSGVRYPSGTEMIFLSGTPYPIYASSPNATYVFGGWTLLNATVDNSLRQVTTAVGSGGGPASTILAEFHTTTSSTSTTSTSSSTTINSTVTFNSTSNSTTEANSTSSTTIAACEPFQGSACPEDWYPDGNTITSGQCVNSSISYGDYGSEYYTYGCCTGGHDAMSPAPAETCQVDVEVCYGPCTGSTGYSYNITANVTSVECCLP